MDRRDYLDEADEDDFAHLVEAARKMRLAAAPVKAAAPAAPPHDTARVELQSAASIVPQTIEWLWPGWLARGRLHLLGGQPGAGKTTLALEFAAIISSGGVQPDGVGTKQASVVIWSGEDDPADRSFLDRQPQVRIFGGCISCGAPARTVDREGLIRRGT